MTKKDFYEILGLPQNATPEEIKKSYRQLALKYHPDRNPDDKAAEEKFKEAAEAYSVLIDPEKRSTYDRFGHDGLRAEGFGGFSALILQFLKTLKIYWAISLALTLEIFSGLSIEQEPIIPKEEEIFL